jgi:hypothetical protein
MGPKLFPAFGQQGRYTDGTSKCGANFVLLVLIMYLQMENGHRATGHQDPFAIVPFRDGSDPRAAPVCQYQSQLHSCLIFGQHALPALHNTDNIRQLTGPQSTRYCTNYGIAQPGNLANRRRLIARHIGYYHEL